MIDSPEVASVAPMSSDRSVATFASTSTVKDSQEIRSRLLHRLGIHDAAGAVPQPMTAAQHRRVRILRGMGVGHNTFKSPPDGSAVRSPLGGVIPSKEPLKDHPTIPTSVEQKPTRIAFADEVDVVAIPTRHEYSDRIKSRIWSNRYELQENAERNAAEFAAEGWNWRTVTDDEGMYICSASGELVHPAWVGDLPRMEENTGRLDRGGPVHS
jgi:hypothetical protein